jgi:DNA adenine methylase
VTARPALRYHGGKFALAEWIVNLMPRHKVYVEPFGGGASVLLRKTRSYAEVYNDLDGEIVNLFEVLRDRTMAAQLMEQIYLTPYARTEFEKSYVPATDPVEQARRTLFRASAGHSSSAATGQKTGFRNDTTRARKTPCATWANIAPGLVEITERLQGVIIENKPAIDVLREFDGAGTLFYVDPPYVFDTRGSRYAGRMYRHEMTDDEHRQLAAMLHSIEGMVMLSGYHSTLYDELYGDWQQVQHRAYTDSNNNQTEVLWMSPNVRAAAPLFDHIHELS